jgi:hypothetical protein
MEPESGPERSSLFIASTDEGRKVAKKLQRELDGDADVTVWDQGVFPPGAGTLETLITKASQFDFAAVIIQGDDWVESRGAKSLAPRDNIMFELGLFMGHLGRDRTFMIVPEDNILKLPSDLAGITQLRFRPRAALQAALGPTADSIRDSIQRMGRRTIVDLSHVPKATIREPAGDSVVPRVIPTVSGWVEDLPMHLAVCLLVKPWGTNHYWLQGGGPTPRHPNGNWFVHSAILGADNSPSGSGFDIALCLVTPKALAVLERDYKNGKGTALPPGTKILAQIGATRA